VERTEQLDVLRAVGCDSVQGHVFAQAMVESDFLALVAAGQERRRSA
jgi:EAL domain-containing protein (putative c-di-GMP-specific phosphodiesterase class I)